MRQTCQWTILAKLQARQDRWLLYTFDKVAMAIHLELYVPNSRQLYAIVKLVVETPHALRHPCRPPCYSPSSVSVAVGSSSRRDWNSTGPGT